MNPRSMNEGSNVYNRAHDRSGHSCNTSPVLSTVPVATGGGRYPGFTTLGCRITVAGQRRFRTELPLHRATAAFRDRRQHHPDYSLEAQYIGPFYELQEVIRA